ncbi:MAG: hypothetical protein H6R21_1698 [Proteobacteria bacterium]|nr:hypothetical protein [Pseudomonadota bacterium]
MRYALIALSILLGTATPVMAQVSVGISMPGVSIGINLPVYPELVLVPGYPVYYAPRVPANYFFYDGLYWVYQHDNWYVSSWYNGPWDLVHPDDVPLFVLRVPVRYYLAPPVYFYGWVVTAPPRWDLYWGPRWVQHHHGWDRWDRHVIHAPAPLPAYQRHYSGDRYPRTEYQHVIRREHYRYQPREAVVRQHYQQRETPRAQAPAQPAPQVRPEAPRAQPAPRDRADVQQRPAPTQAVPQQRAPAVQEQRPQPRPERERRAQAPAQAAPPGRPEVPRAQPTPRERADAQRPVPAQAVPQTPVPAVPVQRPQLRAETERRAQSPVQRAAQGGVVVPQAQPMPRERADPQRPVANQAVAQQRAPAVQERLQQPRQETGPAAPQAPRPQQIQQRGPQGRGDARQPGENPERGQRSGQERGGERNQGRP